VATATYATFVRFALRYPSNAQVSDLRITSTRMRLITAGDDHKSFAEPLAEAMIVMGKYPRPKRWGAMRLAVPKQ
jgi:hypothetical protein